MRVCRFLPLVGLVGCEVHPKPDPDLEQSYEQARVVGEQRREAEAERDARTDPATVAARAALAKKLGLSAEAVASGWTVEVMPGGLAVGMVDGASGLCAVLLYADDALAVSGIGRPPVLPAAPAMLYAGISDLRHDHMVRAGDDFAALQRWSADRCGGTP